MMRARAVRWGLSVVVPLACLSTPAGAATCDASGWFCEPEPAAPAPEQPNPPAADEPEAPNTAEPTDGDLDEPASPAPVSPAPAGPSGTPSPEGPPPPLSGAAPGDDAADGDMPPSEASDADGYSTAHLVEVKPRTKRSLRQKLRKAMIVRAETAFIEDGAGRDPRIAGAGAAFRLRPVPHFGLEAGLDVLMGRDWNGYDRTEVVGSLSGLLFLSPRSKVQVYIPLGFNLSQARVEMESELGDRNVTYTYVGAHLGLGAEIPLKPGLAVGSDLIWFVHERTDADPGDPPEFTDGNTGQTTNTSGGLLLRLGMSFYF